MLYRLFIINTSRWLMAGLLCQFIFVSNQCLAEIEPPSKQVTASRLINDIREIIRIKIEEMKGSYTVRETRPGLFVFRSKGDEIVAYLQQSVLRQKRTDDKEGMEWIEMTAVSDAQNHGLFKEVVRTFSKNAPLVKGVERVFFSDIRDYELGDNEDARTVSLSLDDKEIYYIKFFKTRLGKQSWQKQTQVNFQGVNALNFSEFVNLRLNPRSNVERRTFTYEKLGKSIKLKAFGCRTEIHNWTDYVYTADALKSKGYLTPYYVFKKNQETILGDTNFANDLAETIYKPLYKFSGQDFVQCVADHYFPKTQKAVSFASSDRFKTELEQIQVALQSKTQSQLDTALSLVKDILNGLKNGLINITDQRPKKAGQ